MKRCLTLGCCLLVHLAWAAADPQQPAPFSTAPAGDRLPQGWTLATAANIPRATRFDLVKDGDSTVLRAISEAAAASVTHKLELDPAQKPLLRWRWKVSRVIDKADLASKAGDDYAARVYVFFDYDIARLPFLERSKLILARTFYGADLPTATLCYVWDNRHPIGTSAWSAYTDRVRMIVLESGASKVGQWVTETRNVVADFHIAFGDEAPIISGVAVAADTDNTGETVTSYFGDIVFQASPGSPQ